MSGRAFQFSILHKNRTFPRIAHGRTQELFAESWKDPCTCYTFMRASLTPTPSTPSFWESLGETPAVRELLESCPLRHHPATYFVRAQMRTIPAESWSSLNFEWALIADVLTVSHADHSRVHEFSPSITGRSPRFAAPTHINCRSNRDRAKAQADSFSKSG